MKKILATLAVTAIALFAGAKLQAGDTNRTPDLTPFESLGSQYYGCKMDNHGTIDTSIEERSCAGVPMYIFDGGIGQGYRQGD